MKICILAILLISAAAEAQSRGPVFRSSTPRWSDFDDEDEVDPSELEVIQVQGGYITQRRRTDQPSGQQQGRAPIPQQTNSQRGQPGRPAPVPTRRAYPASGAARDQQIQATRDLALQILQKAYNATKKEHFKLMHDELSAGDIVDDGDIGTCMTAFAWVYSEQRNVLHLCDAFFNGREDIRGSGTDDYRLSVMLHESFHMAGNPGSRNRFECDADAAAKAARRGAGFSRGAGAYGC